MSLSRRLTALLALATSAALLTSCASSPGTAAAPQGETRTVSSAYGDVVVPAHAERVAAVSYDTPWQLKSLDVRPVATIDYSRWLSDYSDDQQAFIKDAATIGTFGEINFEALTAADPDLIIGDAFEVDEATFHRLQSIAPTVIVGGENRGDWQQQTEQTAAATGTTSTWEAGKAAYETLRDSTKTTYADVIARNVWINFSFGDDAGQFSVQLPSGSTGNLVVNELGLAYGPGAHLEDTERRGYVALPLEKLPSVFDKVTFALTFSQQDGTKHDQIQKIIDSEIFQTLPVAAPGKVYGMRTTVTDYASAKAWVEELVTNVLEPLGT